MPGKKTTTSLLDLVLRLRVGPMLARSGRLPTNGDYAYELKWDGFRALLSTESRARLRSRRGWDMTDLVPELATFPV